MKSKLGEAVVRWIIHVAHQPLDVLVEIDWLPAGPTAAIVTLQDQLAATLIHSRRIAR